MAADVVGDSAVVGKAGRTKVGRTKVGSGAAVAARAEIRAEVIKPATNHRNTITTSILCRPTRTTIPANPSAS